jgi:hypothetical protein
MMNRKATKLISDLEKSYRLSVNGLDRWHRAGVGTVKQEQANKQLDMNTDKFYAALYSLKALMDNVKE